MISRPEPLEKFLSLLRLLPTVGPKMSERIAFHLLKMNETQIQDFIQCIQDAYDQVRPCSVCGYWDDSNPCRICSDPGRDHGVVCVIETSQDLIAVSKVRDFKGVYHVLGGALSPLEGVGPQDLRISHLLDRLSEGRIKEVILALNPDMEGESTADYLAKQIRQVWAQNSSRNGQEEGEIKITRLAQGIPAGGELEYTDELTLMRAFEGRKEVVESKS